MLTILVVGMVILLLGVLPSAVIIAGICHVKKMHDEKKQKEVN